MSQRPGTYISECNVDKLDLVQEAQGPHHLDEKTPGKQKTQLNNVSSQVGAKLMRQPTPQPPIDTSQLQLALVQQ